MKTLHELLEELRSEPEWPEDTDCTEGMDCTIWLAVQHNRTRKKLLACVELLQEATESLGACPTVAGITAKLAAALEEASK